MLLMIPIATQDWFLVLYMIPIVTQNIVLDIWLASLLICWPFVCGFIGKIGKSSSKLHGHIAHFALDLS